MESEIFFENAIHFCEPNEHQLIETESFLEAAKCIVQFVALFGTAFTPVRSDIDGNVTKLAQIYESNKEKFKHLNSIVENEKDCVDFRAGTDALQWLNRALVYNQIFLTCLIKDYNESETEEHLESLPEDLTGHFSTAYELSLKKHHGWIVQKVFKLCLLATPSRSSLLTYLGFGKKNLDPLQLRQLVIASIDRYLSTLKSNTESVSILLLNHGFQP